MLRKIVLRNTSLPIHDQVNQHHTRSIMLHNMIDRVWAPLKKVVHIVTTRLYRVSHGLGSERVPASSVFFSQFFYSCVIGLPVGQ
jgi:hypothetical protein